MKKLFALILCVVMMSGLMVQAEAKSETKETVRTKQEATKNEFKEEKLTNEFFSKISSWQELKKIALPISGGYENIENKEDYWCVILIESIDKTVTAPVYHDAEYVSAGLGGISLQEIDYDSLMNKYQKIIDIYNTTHQLQLVWNSEILNENYMQVKVNSTNAIEMNHPVTQIGQKVVLKKGAIYWESAGNDGTGKHGIATDTNYYIPDNYIVTVNGFAYYSDETRTTIKESYHKSYNELGEQEYSIKPQEFRMVHICTETTDLGWVNAEDVIRLD